MKCLPYLHSASTHTATHAHTQTHPLTNRNRHEHTHAYRRANTHRKMHSPVHLKTHGIRKHMIGWPSLDVPDHHSFIYGAMLCSSALHVNSMRCISCWVVSFLLRRHSPLPSRVVYFRQSATCLARFMNFSKVLVCHNVFSPMEVCTSFCFSLCE